MACHNGAEVVAEPSLSCRQLSKIVGGMTCVIPIFSLYMRWGVGCDRLLELTQERPVEHAFGSVDNDGLHFAAKTFG